MRSVNLIPLITKVLIQQGNQPLVLIFKVDQTNSNELSQILQLPDASQHYIQLKNNNFIFPIQSVQNIISHSNTSTILSHLMMMPHQSIEESTKIILNEKNIILQLNELQTQEYINQNLKEFSEKLNYDVKFQFPGTNIQSEKPNIMKRTERKKPKVEDLDLETFSLSIKKNDHEKFNIIESPLMEKQINASKKIQLEQSQIIQIKEKEKTLLTNLIIKQEEKEKLEKEYQYPIEENQVQNQQVKIQTQSKNQAKLEELGNQSIEEKQVQNQIVYTQLNEENQNSPPSSIKDSLGKKRQDKNQNRQEEYYVCENQSQTNQTQLLNTSSLQDQCQQLNTQFQIITQSDEIINDQSQLSISSTNLTNLAHNNKEEDQLIHKSSSHHLMKINFRNILSQQIKLVQINKLTNGPLVISYNNFIIRRYLEECIIFVKLKLRYERTIKFKKKMLIKKIQQLINIIIQKKKKKRILYIRKKKKKLIIIRMSNSFLQEKPTKSFMKRISSPKSKTNDKLVVNLDFMRSSLPKKATLLSTSGLPITLTTSTIGVTEDQEYSVIQQKQDQNEQTQDDHNIRMISQNLLEGSTQISKDQPEAPSFFESGLLGLSIGQFVPSIYQILEQEQQIKLSNRAKLIGIFIPFIFHRYLLSQNKIQEQSDLEEVLIQSKKTDLLFVLPTQTDESHLELLNSFYIYDLFQRKTIRERKNISERWMPIKIMTEKEYIFQLFADTQDVTTLFSSIQTNLLLDIGSQKICKTYYLANKKAKPQTVHKDVDLEQFIEYKRKYQEFNQLFVWK